MIAEAAGSHVVGDPAAVIERLGRLVTTTGADELMVTTSTYAHADRLASYRLLARAAGLGEQPARSASAPAGAGPALLPGQIRHA